MMEKPYHFEVPAPASVGWSPLGEWSVYAATHHAMRTAEVLPLKPLARPRYLFENRRSRNISPNEIYKFTTPIPLIAPRTYIFPQY